MSQTFNKHRYRCREHQMVSLSNAGLGSAHRGLLHLFLNQFSINISNLFQELMSFVNCLKLGRILFLFVLLHLLTHPKPDKSDFFAGRRG
jgi:hypothetical protein